MAGYVAYSKEPSARSDNNTQEDGMSQARATNLTNSTSSYGCQLSSFARSSVDSTRNSSAGQSFWKPANISPPDPIVMGWLSRNPFDLITSSMDEFASQETDEKDKLPAQGPRQVRTRLSRLKQTSAPVLSFLLAICLLATVITYVQATYTAEKRSSQVRPLSDLLKTDVSRTLTILRASQGILSALVTLALENVFVLLQWGQLRRPNGVSYLSVLALSPTTGALGTLGLIKSSAPRISAKLWALSRAMLAALVWVSGLALFFNTSLITVYDTAYTYAVQAGVGPFNASLLQPFRDRLHSLAPDYPYETLPYTYFAAAYTLVINPLVSVVAETRDCSDTMCMSYILSGGLEMVVPWVPQASPDHSMVMVKRVPSIQVDFTGPVGDTFDAADCDVFGQSGMFIGIRLCLEQVRLNPASIRAGVFVCERGIDNGACDDNYDAPKMTTQVSFNTLQVSLVAARSNHSIVRVMDATDPVPVPDLDLQAYRDSLRWLLNYSAADLPPPSSIAQSFWSSQMQLKTPSTWGILFQNFQSILVFPFWLFNSKGMGNIEWRENETIPSLPPEFSTEATLVEPYAKIKVQPAMFALFLVLQVLSLAFVGGVVGWAWIRSIVPLKTSSFPLFDIAFRAEVEIDVEGNNRLNDMDDAEIMQLMRDAKAVRPSA